MKFHDLSVMWKEGGVSTTDTQCQPRGAVCKPVIPPTSFEVSRDFDFVQRTCCCYCAPYGHTGKQNHRFRVSP